jgi:hypothetical protein
MKEEIMKEECDCKNTGLIPPSPVPKGTVQAYCPRHKCQRYWPQAQADGSIKFIKM